MLRKLTGSTGGATPVSDGVSRGGFVAAFEALFAFIMTKTDLLTADDLIVLLPAITLAAFMAWAVWDAIDKRLLPRAADAFDANDARELAGMIRENVEKMETGDDLTPGDGL